MTGIGTLEIFKLAIFYASYLYFPVAMLLIAAIVKKRTNGKGAASRIFASFALLVATILAYARFVEPHILLTVRHGASLSRCFPEAGSARLSVFSDAHEGIFKNAIGIDRIARAVDATEPDAVLIAGDFVYFLAPARFADTFSALGAISAPVFAVNGNHDVGLPGPDVGAPLDDALEKIGVTVLNNQIASFEANGRRVEVVGLSELWAGGQDRSLLEARGAAPRLVLTHNPSTARELRPRESVDLMIAGHTHGGQINIPGLTCALMPGICSVARYGFGQTERGLVFVTSGTGMVGLPMRFNAAPRIDVIELSWRACAK